MSPGDRVVCIDNVKVENRLTVRKMYVVLVPPGYPLSDTIYVTNDLGEIAGFYKVRFQEVPKPLHELASIGVPV